MALALLMLGNGILGGALALRAVDAGQNEIAIGVFMAAHFVGFFIGSVNASTLIIRVGSIRAFAAFASLISAIGVAHLLSDNLPLWILLRFIYGYCFAATGVIVESWLNNHALPTTRGRLLAVYGVVSTGALGLSQLAVGFSPPTNLTLFVVSSIIVSLSLVPVALSGILREPRLSVSRRLKISALWRSTPIGVAGALICGTVFSSLLSLGHVYASQSGFSREQIAFFMAMIILAAVFLQFPLGWVSDRMDRRYVIAAATMAAATAAAVLAGGGNGITAQYVWAMVLGGFFIPLYSLCLARANDEVGDDSLLSTAGTILMLFALGSIPGPIISGLLMSLFSPAAFFVWQAAMLFVLFLFTVWQIIRRPQTLTRKENYQVVPGIMASPESLKLDPRNTEDNNAAAQDGASKSH